MEVSENIKRLRKERGWTQSRLAMEAHVSQQAVSFIESRRNEPSMEMIRALAKAFGVQASELIGEDMEEVSQELTGQELKLIRIFRQLNDLGKSLLLTQAESYLLQPELKQEKQSAI